jgi:hypothetical protein
LKKSGYRFPPQIITQEDNNQDHNHSDSSLSSLSSSSHSSVSLSPPTTTYNHIKRRAEERMKACNDQNAKKKKQEESESDGISPPSSSSSSVDPSEALCMHETVWSNIENKPLSIGGFHASNTSTMLFCDPFIKDQDNDDLSSLSDLESPRRKTTQEALWEQIANCQEPKWSPQHSKIQNDKPSLEEEIFPISALQLNVSEPQTR